MSHDIYGAYNFGIKSMFISSGIHSNIFQSNNNNTQAITKIAAELSASPERDEVISFIQNSGRGIMKGFNQK